MLLRIKDNSFRGAWLLARQWWVQTRTGPSYDPVRPRGHGLVGHQAPGLLSNEVGFPNVYVKQLTGAF